MEPKYSQKPYSVAIEKRGVRIIAADNSEHYIHYKYEAYVLEELTPIIEEDKYEYKISYIVKRSTDDFSPHVSIENYENIISSQRIEEEMLNINEIELWLYEKFGHGVHDRCHAPRVRPINGVDWGKLKSACEDQTKDVVDKIKIAIDILWADLHHLQFIPKLVDENSDCHWSYFKENQSISAVSVYALEYNELTEKLYNSLYEALYKKYNALSRKGFSKIDIDFKSEDWQRDIRLEFSKQIIGESYDVITTLEHSYKQGLKDLKISFDEWQMQNMKTFSQSNIWSYCSNKYKEELIQFFEEGNISAGIFISKDEIGNYTLTFPTDCLTYELKENFQDLYLSLYSNTITVFKKVNYHLSKYLEQISYYINSCNLLFEYIMHYGDIELLDKTYYDYLIVVNSASKTDDVRLLRYQLRRMLYIIEPRSVYSYIHKNPDEPQQIINGKEYFDWSIISSFINNKFPGSPFFGRTEGNNTTLRAVDSNPKYLHILKDISSRM